MTEKIKLAHLDIDKMSKEDIIEAIEFLDLLCSNALMKVTDYGKLGFMNEEYPNKHHICVDFKVWLNTAHSSWQKDKEANLNYIERIENFLKFIKDHAYRVEPLNDKEFRAVLGPILEKLKEIEEE